MSDVRPISPFFAEFTDRALEKAFREATHKYAALQNKATAAIATVGFAAFAVFDYVILGPSALFFTLLVFRCAVAVSAVGVFMSARNPQRAGTADITVLVFQFAVGIAMLYVMSAKTPDGFLYPQSIAAICMVVAIVGSYAFVATRLVYSTAIGLALAVGFVVVSNSTGRYDVSEAFLVGGMLALCNALGYWMLNRVQRLARDQYANVLKAHDANQLLEDQSAELTAMTRDLRRARDQATHANRTKSEFLAHMAHELRSPLNAIIGFSEVMHAQLFGPVSPPRYREYIEDIHVSGRHLLAVINDVLDLSKAESGTIELQEAEVCPNAMITDILRLVRERARAKHLRLKTETADDAPYIRADERLLKQILLNLITNAVKFTPEKGTVTVGYHIDTTGEIAFQVTDTGVGIAPDEIPKVLEAYGQAETARVKSDEGTGLGLPLAKSMTELHGGTLTIRSLIGEGTTITVRLPADRVLKRPKPRRKRRAAAG